MIFSEIKSNPIESCNLHILKMDYVTGKLTVKAVSSILDSEGNVNILKLNSRILMKTKCIKGNTFKLATVTDSTTLSVFVLDTYNSKMSMFEADKQTRLSLYKTILGEVLRELIGKLTSVYQQTQSIEIREEINRLMPIYTAYSKQHTQEG